MKAPDHHVAALGRKTLPPTAPFDEDGTYLGDDWTDPDIATDEVEVSVRPAKVDVLRGLFGHRLTAVAMTPHRPARGERRAFLDMFDMRFHFEGRPTVTACGCQGEFSLLPAVSEDRQKSRSGPSTRRSARALLVSSIGS
jgi:hypothetical protein